MTGRILADTGPLLAIFSVRDQHHQKCVELLRALPKPLLTCWPVLTEAAWLLRRQPALVERLLASFGADGPLRLLQLDDSAPPWISAFLRRYRKLRPQLADAALVYLAEREGIETVFTLDRRDFSVYRLRGNRGFQLLPRNLAKSVTVE